MTVMRLVSGFKSAEEHHSKFPTVDLSYEPALIPDTSEQYDSDCFDRVSTTVNRILDKFQGNLLFVGHGASLRAIVNALTGRPAYQGLCTLTKVESTGPNADQWRAIFIGDDSHLSDKTNLRPF